MATLLKIKLYQFENSTQYMLQMNQVNPVMTEESMDKIGNKKGYKHKHISNPLIDRLAIT